MLVVDTNLLVHAANIESPLHASANAWLEYQRSVPDGWFSTWPILYEFMRVVTHRKVLSQPLNVREAWDFVTTLLAAPGFAVLAPTDRHSSVASAVLRELPFLAGNILHDTHTAILMREHGVRRICTRDMDFHRFPFLEVVDPLTG